MPDDVKLDLIIKVDEANNPSEADWYITVALDRCFIPRTPVIISKDAVLNGEEFKLERSYHGFLTNLSKYTTRGNIPSDSSVIMRYYEKNDTDGLYVKKTQAAVLLADLVNSHGPMSVKFTGRKDQKVIPFMVAVACKSNVQLSQGKKADSWSVVNSNASQIMKSITKNFDVGELGKFVWLYNMSGFEIMQNISFLFEEKISSTLEFWIKVLVECKKTRDVLNLPIDPRLLWMDLICIIPSRLFDYTLDLFGDDFESPFIQRNGDCEDFSYAILTLFKALKEADFSEHSELLEIQRHADKYCGFFTVCDAFAAFVENDNAENKYESQEPPCGHVCTLFIPWSRIYKMLLFKDGNTGENELLTRFLKHKYSDKDLDLPIMLGEGTNYLEPTCSSYEKCEIGYSNIYAIFKDAAKILNTIKPEEEGAGFYDRFIQVHTTQIFTESDGAVPFTGFVITSKQNPREYGLKFKDTLDRSNIDNIRLVPLPSISHTISDIAISQARILTPVPYFGKDFYTYSTNSAHLADVENVEIILELLKKLKDVHSSMSLISRTSLSQSTQQVFFINTVGMTVEVLEKLTKFILHKCIKFEWEMFNPAPNWVDFRFVVVT